uniref:Photosystem I reaction center subunit PsaK n=1 Tax=Lophocladia kuetzingii TaxID=675577 RepID=A0A1Z1MNG2_9FLOR|nr:photosystem I reaction center subunit X [Lophocladia kuetzingii]ARW67598.1 photosystem I reaction center subunit X [Lophocladia kuetzingii]
MTVNLNNTFTNLALENSWSIQVAVIMIICNFIAIGIGRYAIKIRGIGNTIPVLGLEGLGLPELLATTSLGHIIGAGTIIGLRSIGLI